MAIACLLILLQIELGEVFLLTNSTNAGLKSYEFQHLSRLIFNEEQSRHHIAKEVDNIEYRMSKLEDGLNAIFKKFTNTVDQLRSSTASLEQRLEQQTKSSDYIRHLFEKEKLNRQQLEHEYSDLEMKFQNLSLSCGVLQNRTDYLEKVLNNGKKKIATHAAYITSNSATMAEVLSNLTTVERGIWSAIAELSQRTAGMY